MIEILKVTLFIIVFFSYIAILLIPTWIAAWTNNDNWCWGLLFTLPFGIALLVVAVECWGWFELIESGC